MNFNKIDIRPLIEKCVPVSSPLGKKLMSLANKFYQVPASYHARPFLGNYPSNSRYAESFRTLRTNIHFSFMGGKFRSILVTSSGQGEGKTSTVINLAYTMSQAGRKVLMVDADLRKPILSKIIPIKDSVGLTGIVTKVFGTEVRGGSLKNISTGDLLKLILFQKKTGILTLSDDNHQENVEIYFFQGDLVDMNLSFRPEDERLVSLLVKNNLITKDQAKLGLDRQKLSGQKIGMLLMSMGFVTEKELESFISMHMNECFRKVLNMKTGEFSFKDIPETEFEGPLYNPVDFEKLYKRLVVGEEELPFLQEKINSAIVKPGPDNLSLLPSGIHPPNPSEILGSRRMEFLVSFLKRKYDVLLFDTPPILPVTDSLLLSHCSDGVLIVIKAGALNRKLIKNCVEQVQKTQGNLIGAILNNVDINKEGYYKYYRKYYSEYYDERD